MDRFLLAFLVSAIGHSTARCGKGDLAFERLRADALLSVVAARGIDDRESERLDDATGLAPWPPHSAPLRRSLLDGMV